MLELFSGTGRMAAAFREMGYKTLTVDLDEPADLNADVRELDARAIINKLGGRPRVIWASPPCTSFSIAAVRHHHFEDGTPKTDAAQLGVELLAHTLRLIMALKPQIWYIENPRGMMRKLPLMKFLPRRTLTFCAYGDPAMKPTDVWTNNGMWWPRPMCRPNAPCHESSPRGSKNGGTQAKKNAKERGALPVELCREVASL